MLIFGLGFGLLRGQNVSADFAYTDCGCPGSAGPQVELTIHNGLVPPWGGQVVADADEESKGAITITNWNDTDGDGIKDSEDIKVSAAATGREELDLMVLDISLTGGAVAPGCDSVHFRLSSGLRLWGFSTKQQAIGSSIPISQLPKRVYVEAVQVSNTVRDMEVLAGLIDEAGDTVRTDRVVVTAIWVEHDTAYHVRSPFPTPSNLGINEPFLLSAINQQYKGLDGNKYGTGVFEHLDASGANTGFDDKIGGRILHQFSILPNDIRPHLSSFGISYDITRRIMRDNRFIGTRGVRYETTGFQMQNELSDDDSNDRDEDLTPSTSPKNKIFSFDGPSASRRWPDFSLERNLLFEEFVRVSFGSSITGNTLSGSACSQKLKWRYEGSYVSSGTTNRNLPYLDTDVILEEVAPNATIVASRPRKSPIYSGTGTVLLNPISLIDPVADYYVLTAIKDSAGLIAWDIMRAPSVNPQGSFVSIGTTTYSATGPWMPNLPEIHIGISSDGRNPFLEGTELKFIVFRPRRTHNIIED